MVMIKGSKDQGAACPNGAGWVATRTGKPKR